jgi:hypothetical protein
MPFTTILASPLARPANVVLAFWMNRNFLKAKKIIFKQSPSHWVHAVILT